MAAGRIPQPDGAIQMSKPVHYEYPEPVPPVSQLLALPFVAAVAGYLVQEVGCTSVRVTLHRVMTRDECTYLQQICSYAGHGFDHSKAGRIFVVDEGIIGKAFADGRIVRTGRYENEDAWWRDYLADRSAIGDERPVPTEPISFLAVPFIDATNAVVCVLYVEAGGLNLFVDGGHLGTVLGMSGGYCGLLDDIAARPLPRVRNFPLPVGRPVTDIPTIFPQLQETLTAPLPPRLSRLTSYNFAPTV